ncbi:MAG: hypothetical protein HKN82_08780 [Akkermansiaceae bacterium]|nr:hypothetical protein [Akkermansiaceae bacterium]
MGLLLAGPVHAFGFFGGNGLNDGARWDTEPRTVGGVERSLDGGLRFSVTGGSYENFRDEFRWSGTPPPVAEFRQAVLDAFAAWEAVDPVTGLQSELVFTEDFTVAVTVGRTTGAEIDLIATDRGNSGRNAYTRLNWGNYKNFLLTSGTRIRAQPISGADVEMNNNSGARWSLAVFRTVLAHEIGHAIGLRDVDVDAGPNGRYVDDNYDGTTSATAAATLTNSFALLVNPLDPPASPLTLYTVANGNPGFDSPGALVFMETSISSAFNPRLVPLTNDEYAGRQFLYPSVRPRYQLAAAVERLGDRVRISWQGLPTRSYWVDHSDDGTTWTTINGSPVPAAASGRTETDDTDAMRLDGPAGLYRVRLAGP